MTTKLPTYFEKYFETKFGEVYTQISELKLHVNDEILEMKKILASHDASLKRIYVIAGVIAVAFVIHEAYPEAYPGDLINLIKSLFI